MVGICLALAFLTAPEPVPPPLPEPDVEDLMRFPCQWVAEASRDAARQHVAWLKAQVGAYRLQRDPDWIDWLAEARDCHDAWQELHQAHCWAGCPDCESCCRDSLRELRQRLGADYDRGIMPPPTPYWRFRRAP